MLFAEAIILLLISIQISEKWQCLDLKYFDNNFKLLGLAYSKVQNAKKSYS